MKPMIDSFLEHIKKELPNVFVKVDAPAQPEGHWFVDINLEGHKVVAEWHPEKGFGVSSALEDGYGEGPEEVFPNPESAAIRVIEVLRTRTYTRPPDTVLLRELRALSKLTQEDIAKRLGIAQGAVSRMERRQDMSISTLRRLVGAMGGELELVARFPDKTVHIGQFNGEGEDVHEQATCVHVSAGLGLNQELSTTIVPPPKELASALTSWMETLSRLCSTNLPLTINVLDSLDDVCRTEGLAISIGHPLARSLSMRISSPLSQACTRLISHEVCHYLLDMHGIKPGGFDAELGADHFAGWVDGRHEHSPSVGASVFYELGCHHTRCTHPPPRLRLEAYLAGYKEGAAGHPHALVGGKRHGSEKEVIPSLLSLPHCAGGGRRDADDSFGAGLRYLVIRTSSLERTQRFYSALGVKLSEEKHGTGPRHYAATLGNSVLEFYPSAKGKRSTRIGIRVQSIEDSLCRVRLSGFPAALVHYDAEKVMLHDPDGNDVELVANN